MILNYLLSINKIFRKFEVFLVALGIIVTAFITVGNVFSRTFLGSSWQFAEEICQACMVIVTFIGTSYAARLGSHIWMSSIFDRVSTKKQKAMKFIINFFTMIFLIVVAKISLDYVLIVKNSGRVTSSLLIPMWTFYLSVPIGFILTAYQYFINLILNIKSKDKVIMDNELSI